MKSLYLKLEQHKGDKVAFLCYLLAKNSENLTDKDWNDIIKE